MNPLKWAKEVAKELREEKNTTSSLASFLKSRWDESRFTDPQFLFWFFNTLARDVERAWRVPGIRTESSTRVYTPRPLMSEDDYRDVLCVCREDCEKYMNKGRQYLALACEKGFTQLRLEFPEFDVQE